MNRLIILIYFCILGICFHSCQQSTNKEAQTSQNLLDESELLIESREFKEAYKSAKKALNTIQLVIKKDKKNPDFQLLEIRALLNMFMAQNTLIIENSNIRPRSLVRLPFPEDYQNLEETLVPAKKQLIQMANEAKNLSFEQEGYIHSSLATIFRLNLTTLNQADKEYNKSIKHYYNWVDELQATTKSQRRNALKVENIKNQIQNLKIAQIEVNLLKENWNRSLDLLQITMGNSDLQYFSTHFSLLENQIEGLIEKLQEYKKKKTGTRENNLTLLLEKIRKQPLSKKENLARTNPYVLELNHLFSKLTDLKNNLLYRIICYHNLKDKEKLKESTSILLRFYPELQVEVDTITRSSNS